MQNHELETGIPGFTLAEALGAFSPLMLAEVSVNEWVLQKLHPFGPRCPLCKTAVDNDRTAKSFAGGGRVRCKACNKWYTNTTNTILHGSQLTFIQFYLIAVLSEFAEKTGSNQARAREMIARIIDIHPDTVASWQASFKTLEACIA